MTENEAIKELETSINLAKMCTQNYERKREIQGYEMAINALEGVQQYRAIGTLEELKAAMKYVYLAKKHGTVGQVIENCVKYEEIGTPEECLQNKDFLDFISDKMNPNDFETYLRLYNALQEKGCEE